MLSVLDSGDPAATDQVINQFTLAGEPRSLLISSGLALVPSGVGGLFVVSFLGPDLVGIRPMAELNLLTPDVQPGVDGVQLTEQFPVALSVSTTDDVQVRRVDLLADGNLATRYRCDGLIIATPVGSTAHNLSAGGPILRRRLQAMVISPISAHTLTYRPLVDSADTRLELTVTEPNESTSIVVDGRILGRLMPGDRVRIERDELVFQMLSVHGQDDYRSLREKLGWGGSVSVNRSPV